MVWPVVTVAEVRPGGEEGGRATRPEEPSNSEFLEAPQDKRGFVADSWSGDRSALPKVALLDWRGVTTLTTMADQLRRDTG